LFVLRLDILMKNNPKLSVEELTTYWRYFIWMIIVVQLINFSYL
jgi:hypothetical protein